ncbi:MAG: phosphodiester glycosidase family protein [Candidatus Izemoplasmatales bacterium]
MIKKCFQLSFVFIILFGHYLINASSKTFTLGSLDSQETISVEDITYNKYVINTASSDQHIVHNIEIGRYSDFEVVLHDQLYGEDAQGLSTVLNIALDYEAKTGKVVYAAVNGDFFSTLPIDFYAKENNILRIGNYNKNAFAFTSAHRTKVGKVDYGYKVNIYDENNLLVDFIHIDKFNQTLEDGEVGVFTPDFTSEIIGENIAKLNVSNDLILNKSDHHYKGHALNEMTNFDDLNYTLSNDEFVLAAKGSSPNYEKILNLISTGTNISIYPYPVNDWDKMEYIIGGWQILLDRGVKLPEEIHGSATARHPRTTIGVNRDGVIGLTVVDGRLVNIPGLTLNELADLNEDLGYYNALELDGGGSSTCLLRNLETNELEVMNTPADGHLRKVANAVLIVGDPIKVDEPITTETPTTEEPITSYQPTTYISPTTSQEQTTEIPTTFISTTKDSTYQETTLSSGEIIDEGCSSCNNVNVSILFFGIMSLMTIIIFRKK